MLSYSIRSSPDTILTTVSYVPLPITSNTYQTMSVSDVIPDADAWMSTEEQSLASMLLSEDQGHIFAAWTPGEHEDKKHALFEQVRAALAPIPAVFLSPAQDPGPWRCGWLQTPSSPPGADDSSAHPVHCAARCVPRALSPR